MCNVAQEYQLPKHDGLSAPTSMKRIFGLCSFGKAYFMSRFHTGITNTINTHITAMAVSTKTAKTKLLLLSRYIPIQNKNKEVTIISMFSTTLVGPVFLSC